MSGDAQASTMRMARLWSAPADQMPVLDPILSRTDDADLKQRVLSYLKGGDGVLRAPMLLDDQIDRSRKEKIPFVLSTDGEWIWSAEHEYYLEHYGVLPEQAFLDHMAAHGYIAPTPSPEAVAAAERLLEANDPAG